MHAIRFHRQGPPDVLQLDELPDPSPGPGQVLLDVRSASVNHLDIFVRRDLPRIPTPRIPGADAAGVVLAVGEGVTAPAVGDEVLIDPGYSCGTCLSCVSGEPTLCRGYGILGESCDGTYATRLVVAAEACFALPRGWDFGQGAAFPLTALTAWRMMISRGLLRAGEDVLILGGAAGVGVMAIQIAAAAGCRVFATASTDAKRALCRELGASEVLDSRDPDWWRHARKLGRPGGLDVIVDYVGKDTWTGTLRATRSGGRVLTCGATTGWDPTEDLRQIFFRQITVVGSTMGSRADLAAALALAERGQLRPVIDRRFPLDRAAEAHQAIEDRSVVGKLVLEMP